VAFLQISPKLMVSFTNLQICEPYDLGYPISMIFALRSCITPGFKGQRRVHLIHAPKKTTYIITECIEINVTIIRVLIT
jgi:hypothetical protein